MSATSTLFRQSEDFTMPRFFNKTRLIDSTELGLPRDPKPIIDQHSAHTRGVKPNSPSWFCATVGSCPVADLTHKNKTATATPPPASSAASPLFDNHEECHIPHPVLTLLIHLAQQGVRVGDMFRRPGNVAHMKCILEKFIAGEPIPWEEYNVYTVANVAKKLLLSIPGGLFGPVGESELLATATHASCASETIDLGGGSAPPSQPSTPCRLDAMNRSAWGGGGGMEPKSVTFATDEAGNEPGGQNAAWQTRKLTSSLPWPLAAVRQLHQLYDTGERRISVCLRVLDTLPPSHQQTIILILGILHQLIFRSTSSGCASSTTAEQHMRTSLVSPHDQTLSAEDESSLLPTVPLLTLAEGVVKSVAGTLFHTCSISVSRVEQAAQVLRSLVLYFPIMGETVTRFYADAIAGRLPFAPTTTISPCAGAQPQPQQPLPPHLGRPSEKATLTTRPPITTAALFPIAGSPSTKPACVLCPQSDHASYFDQQSVASCGRRPCPINLFQAASRLFCMSGANTGSNPSTPSKPTAASGSWAKRHVRRPCLKKPWTEDVKSSAVNEQRPCKIPPPVPISVPDQRSDEYGDRGVELETQITNRTLNGEANQSNPCTNEMESLPDRPLPTLLRRNQSRYRSLRRRQMENLSRRAAWFLGPTVMPVVTLKPSWGSCADSHCCCSNTAAYVHPPEMVVQSTVSLLELGDETAGVGKNFVLAVPPAPIPRLLFTASTGELERGQNPSEYDDSEEVTHNPGPDANRLRLLLSVGSSSLIATSAEGSVVSVHSAPPPAGSWIQAGSSELNCECPKYHHHTPLRSRQSAPLSGGGGTRARSASPRPFEPDLCIPVHPTVQGRLSIVGKTSLGMDNSGGRAADDALDQAQGHE